MWYDLANDSNLSNISAYYNARVEPAAIKRWEIPLLSPVILSI